MADTEVSKNILNFYCENCDYKCSKKSLWDKHCLTHKHKMADKDLHVSKSFQCKCGKTYKHRQSLFKHKNVCDLSSNNADHITTENNDMPNIIITESAVKAIMQSEPFMALIQQNKELHTILADQNSKLFDMVNNNGITNINTNNTNNSHNIHSNNKTFNLQFFLNETCKNAMNMSQFIEQMQISLEDLEETGRIGYVEGISKLFIKNLKNLEITDRPIHCSDAKRETLYIKNEDVWTKNDDINRLLTNAIKEVAKKNSMQIGDWQKKYPGYKDPDSRDSDKYQKMILNNMPGSTKDECSTNYNKIIKNIAKEVIIQK